MKKISVILSAAVVLLGAVSCNKEKPYDGEPGTGKLTISYGFNDDAKSRASAYDPSTIKPTTSWQQNIKTLTLFLVESGTIKVALPIAFNKVTGIAAQNFTFSNVPAGNYTGHLIANYDQGDIEANFTSATTGSALTGLTMDMPKNLLSSTATAEAAEIFVAQLAGVNVVANQSEDYSNTPFQLTRAVSMMRVRVNKNFTGNTPGGAFNNNDIDLGDDAAALHIRKAGTGLRYSGTAWTTFPAAPANADVVYVAGWNTNGTIPAGYGPSDGKILEATQQAWKDVRIFPGGSSSSTGTTAAQRFNIMIAGMAPTGYVPLGATTGLTAEALVYWQGTVTGAITANNILEVNVELKTQGSTTPPVVTETGDLAWNLSTGPPSHRRKTLSCNFCG